MTTLRALNAARLNELYYGLRPYVSNLIEGRKYKDSSFTVKQYRSDKVLNRLNNLNNQ